MSLEIKNIEFSYGDHKVLDGVSFGINSGEIIGLLGPNGTGKTTLMKCVGGIFEASAGESLINGENILKISPKERAKFISYVPQFSQVTFPISVFDTVLMGRQPFVKFTPKKSDKEKALYLLDKLGLTKYAFKNVMSLSGGERQRVMIARAMAQDPQLLLLDEPTSSLDIKYQVETMNLVETLAKEQNIMVIISIHDLNLAAMFCDKFLMLKNGVVSAFGGDEVLNPQSIYEVYGIQTQVQTLEGHKHIAIYKRNKRDV